MFGLLLLLLLVGIPLAGFWVSGYLHRPLPLEEPVLVEVAPGSSFNGLLAGMRADGLLGEPPEARLRRWSARLYSAVAGVDARLHVGEYQLSPGDSLLTLLEKIDRGDVLQRSVTLVEGWNFREWRARLAGLEGIEHTLVDLDGAAVMARPGITTRVDLGAGDGTGQVWTCDFSYDYVKINAEYRT